MSDNSLSRLPHLDLYEEFESILAQSDTGIRYGEEANVADPVIKRARRSQQGIEIPECCVCMEVAAPLVVYDCDHIGCGPCTRKLEEPRAWRSAGFKCPQCRFMVHSYTVPLFMREKTIEAASDEQRELAEEFLRQYRKEVSDARAQPQQRDEVARVSAPGPLMIGQAGEVIGSQLPPDRAAVDAELAAFLSLVPRSLASWDATFLGGESFGTDIEYVRNGVISRTAERRSFARRLRARLRRGGIIIQYWTMNRVRLRLPLTDLSKFDLMRW